MSSPLVERLAWTLIHSLWQGFGVAFILAIALGFAYRSSSRLRYALGCAALAALALLPLGTFLSFAPRADLAGDGTSYAVGTGTAALSGALVVPPIVRPDLLSIVVGIWIFGVALLSLRLLGSLLQIERWRRAMTTDEELTRRAESLARRLGISTPIRVLVASQATVPCTWGVVRPVLAVPLSLVTGLPPLQLEAILLHELAHIRRFDYLVNVLQTFVETILFFHPATWWISSFVRREREHCCDDLVVATLGDPYPYARALLHLEERRHAPLAPALSAQGGHLMNRIQRILSRPAAPSRLLPAASALATLALMAVFVGGAIQAQAEPQRPASAPASAPISERKAAPRFVRQVRPAKVQSKKPSDYPKFDRVLLRVRSRTSPAKAPYLRLDVPRTRKQNPEAVRAVKSAAAARQGARREAGIARVHAARAAEEVRLVERQRALARERQVFDESLIASRVAKVANRAQLIERERQIREERLVASRAALVAQERRIMGQATRSAERERRTAIQAAQAERERRILNERRVIGQIVEEVDRASAPAMNSRTMLVSSELQVKRISDAAVTLKAKHVPLQDVLTELAQEMGISIVIESGSYGFVTAVLQGKSIDEALIVLCRAGGATHRAEGGIVYVSPKAPAAPRA